MSTENTQGSLTKEAVRLAWPAVCESFFIALAGMVDTFMVSTLFKVQNDLITKIL